MQVKLIAYSAYILKPVLSGRNFSVRLVSKRRIKTVNFENFDISHNSFLCPEYFIDFLCER